MVEQKRRLLVLPGFRVVTSAFRVNLFQLLYSTVGRMEEFIVEAFRVKPSERLQLVLFIGRLFSYVDELNKLGIREVQ